MEDRGWDDPDGRRVPVADVADRTGARRPRTAPTHLKRQEPVRPRRRRPLRRWLRAAYVYLPRGNTLDDETFRHRHLLMCWVLALHIPALFAFGVWQGYGVRHAALEVAMPAACLAFARLARNRRAAAFFVTAGLVFCSSVLVHLSGGTIEAHFHFFILIGLIALYQDWVPFLWNVVFTVLSHGLGSAIASDLMFNHGAAQDRPWHWALIHGVAVLAACVGVIVFWKNTELEQQRSTTLLAELAESELASVQAQAAQRQSISELYVNLARRNQSLLDRQLALIAELEQRESKPQALADLFQLDHLATRIRRNAESLLVLSGDEPPRLWGRPVPLADVVRAAAAEVEDYPRVEVLVNDYLEVPGRVVADLAHLLAELIENATVFSPPTTEVRVRTHLVPNNGATFVLSVEDIGVGMTESELQGTNQMLADPPELDPSHTTTLGFHVVARLAQRLGLDVSLAHTPGGGTTALVTLPDGVVNERQVPAEPIFAGGGGRPDDWPLRSTPRRDLARSLAPAGAATAVLDPGAPATSPAPVVPVPIGGGPPTVEGSPVAPATPMPVTSADPHVVIDLSTPARPTVDGLVRRVPGASLSPALRRGFGGSPNATGRSSGSSPSDPATAPAAGGPGRGEQTGLMLSRFQASQRAGRAAAASDRDGHGQERSW